MCPTVGTFSNLAAVAVALLILTGVLVSVVDLKSEIILMHLYL